MMQPTTEQLAEQLDRIEDILRDDISDRMIWRQRVESELAENTKITTEIRTAATALGWIKRTIVWLGGLAVGLAGIVGLLQMFRPGIAP
jgi:hypothetical protein